MIALAGSCHCGRVRITLPRKPDEITLCNCSLCAKTGFQGVYFPSGELHIEGEFDSYVREDLSEPCLRNHRCRHCGVATHWTLLSDPPYDRMGVNARLLEPDVLKDVPVREVDGRSWET
ncbi:MAG: GFA family protein [Sphingomicrobium sp.]